MVELRMTVAQSSSSAESQEVAHPEVQQDWETVFHNPKRYQQTDQSQEAMSQTQSMHVT